MPAGHAVKLQDGVSRFAQGQYDRHSGHVARKGTQVGVLGSEDVPDQLCHLLLEQGEELALEFTVPGVPRPMRAHGRVAWVRRFPEATQAGGMGFEFVAMTEEDRAVLAEYLSPS